MASSKKNSPLQSVRDAVSTLFSRSTSVKTSSGREIKVNHTIGGYRRAKKDVRARKKAEYLASLPKSRFKRFFYKLHPRRMAQYWFSRQGLITMLKISGVGFLAMMLLVIGVFAYFRKDLPNIQDITAANKGGSIRYYDKTGQNLLWEDFESFKRIPVKYGEISQPMKDATVAVEDKDFFVHGGFNLRGIIRAAINNARGKSTQGGSTITQQFVKNTQDWSKDRTVTRKIKELILSVELERSYTKQDILAGYLNIVPYGAFEVGVESAAEAYFNKSAKDLNIEESAFLAAIPKSPQYFSPYSPDFDRDLFNDRKNYILNLMYDQGRITKAQRDKAKAVDLLPYIHERKPKYEGIKAPYFVLAAKDELAKRYGQNVISQSGWKVVTTLDMNIQKMAEDAVANGMRQVQRQGGNNAALVAEESQTGKVIAMVGGNDFNNPDYGKINFATTPRAPGSSVKPYDYAALMQQSKNWGAGSVIYDIKTQLDGWGWPNGALQDYDKVYPGPQTVRYALAGSRNVPAVKAFYMAGIDNVRALQKKLGVVSGLNCPGGTCGLSAGIGDGAELKLNEHVSGFSSFARNGVYKQQTYIDKIIKTKESKEEIFYQWKDSAGSQVLDAQIAYIIGDITSDPNASYLYQKNYFKINGHQMSVKTGTTNNSDNGWMMGFSTVFTAGVWVGRNDAKAMSGFMEDMTGPIWYNFMKAVHANAAPVARKRPDGIKELSYDVAASIKLSRSGARLPSKNTDLFPSWYVPLNTQAGQRAVIDTVTGKLATECTPERAKKEVVSGKIAVELPTTDPSYSKWAAAISAYYSGSNVGAVIPTSKDDVHKCDDIKPSINLTVTGGSGTYTLKADVAQGTHALKTVNFKIDGQILPGGSFDISSPGTVSYNYDSQFEADKTIVAEVVDSALYDAEDSKTVTLQSASEFSLDNPQIGGVNVKFNWSSQGSADNYRLCYTKSGGSPNCVTTGNTSYTITKAALGGAGSYTAFVDALVAGTAVRTSNSVNFSF